MPADASINNRGAGRLNGARQGDYFFQTRAFLNQIQHRKPINNNEIGTHSGPHLLNDFHREANAIGVAAAPFIAAVIGAGGDEFVDQIAFRTHDFNAIIASALRQNRAMAIVINGAEHIIRTEFARRKRVDRRFDRAGSHQRLLVGIAAEMQDLHRDFSAFRVYCGGDGLVRIGLRLRGHFCAATVGPADIVWGNTASNDQTHTAASALCIKCRHARETVFRLFQAHVHRTHDHAIAQLGKAQI